MSDADLPFFRFHPDPVATGYIRSSDEACESCGRTRGWIYEGSFHAVEEITSLCPWCIADSTAATRFDGEFVDATSVEPVADPADLDELTHRTPGYTSWQQEEWPSHCGIPCAYHGLLSNDVLADIDPATFASDLPPWLTLEELDEVVPRHSGAYREMFWTEVHHFRCLRCGAHRVKVNQS